MLYRKTVNSCVGGWINVYQQVRGIATLVDFYLTVRDPTGKSIHVFNVQHHLCLITLTSLMPASLFSHSLSKLVSLLKADTQNRTENWRLETSDFATKLYPHIDGPYTGKIVVAVFPDAHVLLYPNQIICQLLSSKNSSRGSKDIISTCSSGSIHS